MDWLDTYITKLNEAPTAPRSIPSPHRAVLSSVQQRYMFDAAADYERQQLVAEERRRLETHRGNDYPAIASTDNIDNSVDPNALLSIRGTPLRTISGKILKRIL